MEEQPVVKNEYNIYNQQREKNSGAIIDWFMTALVVIIAIAIIATYFVEFDAEADLNIKKATTQTLWLAVGTFCVGELSKRIFRRKGEKTEEYRTAETEANAAIKELNESPYADSAADYCKHVTDTTIERYRKHQLVTVGIDMDTFESAYLGKGIFYLFKHMLKGTISFLQLKAIWRCNHIKTKAYDPRFITSYNSEDNSELVPSEQNNTRKADRKNSFTSVLFSIGSAAGIGFVFHDVLVNFSAEVLFLAIVKIVIMAINFALKATFGWNLSIMDIRRNRLRKSEAQACIAYAKANKADSQKMQKKEGLFPSEQLAKSVTTI